MTTGITRFNFILFLVMVAAILCCALSGVADIQQAAYAAEEYTATVNVELDGATNNDLLIYAHPTAGDDVLLTYSGVEGAYTALLSDGIYSILYGTEKTISGSTLTVSGADSAVDLSLFTVTLSVEDNADGDSSGSRVGLFATGNYEEGYTYLTAGADTRSAVVPAGNVYAKAFPDGALGDTPAYEYVWSNTSGATNFVGTEHNVTASVTLNCLVTGEDGTFSADVVVNQDNVINNGYLVYARPSAGEDVQLIFSDEYDKYTAKLANGTYSVLYGADKIDTGSDLVVNRAVATVNLNFYTVSAEVSDVATGTSENSTIGLYKTNNYESGDSLVDASTIGGSVVVISGTTVYPKVFAKGAEGNGSFYTYAWSGASGNTASLVVVVTAKTDLSCEVTGTDGTFTNEVNISHYDIDNVNVIKKTDLSVVAYKGAFESFVKTAGVAMNYNSDTTTYCGELYAGAYCLYVGDVFVKEISAGAPVGEINKTFEIVYYQILAQASMAGSATGSNLTVVEGVASGYVLSGTDLSYSIDSENGAKGEGAAYTYAWTVNGTAEGSEDTFSKSNVTAACNIECIVTGVDGYFELTATIYYNGELWRNYAGTVSLKSGGEPYQYEGITPNMENGIITFRVKGRIGTAGDYSPSEYEVFVNDVLFDTKDVDAQNVPLSINYYDINFQIGENVNASSSTVCAYQDDGNGRESMGTTSPITVLAGTEIEYIFVVTPSGAFGSAATYAYEWYYGLPGAITSEDSAEYSLTGINEIANLRVNVTGTHGTFAARINSNLDGTAYSCGAVTLKLGDASPIATTYNGGIYSVASLAAGEYDILIDGVDSGKNLSVVANANTATNGASANLDFYTVRFLYENTKGEVDGISATIVKDNITYGCVSKKQLDGTVPVAPSVTAKNGYERAASFWNTAIVAVDGEGYDVVGAFVATQITLQSPPTALELTHGDTISSETQKKLVLSQIVINGDSDTGTVSYAVDVDSELPQGLSLNLNGYLQGTVLGALAEAARVEFVITGKNGTTVNFTVDISVAKKTVSATWSNYANLSYTSELLYGTADNITAQIPTYQGTLHTAQLEFVLSDSYDNYEVGGDNTEILREFRNAGTYKAIAKLPALESDSWNNYTVENLVREVAIGKAEVDVRWTYTTNSVDSKPHYTYTGAQQSISASFVKKGTEGSATPAVYALNVSVYKKAEYEEEENPSTSIFLSAGDYVLVASYQTTDDPILTVVFANHKLKESTIELAATMKKAPLSVAWNSSNTGATYTYTGIVQTITSTITLLNTSTPINMLQTAYDEAEYTAAEGDVTGLSELDFKNAGIYRVVARLPEANASVLDNYNLEATSLTEVFTINKKSVHVAWSATTKSEYTHNGNDLSGNVFAFATGIVGAPNSSLDFDLTFTLNGVAAVLKNVGVYTATATVKSADAAYLDNYTFTNTTKTIEIAAKLVLPGDVLSALSDEAKTAIENYQSGETLPTPVREGYSFDGWYLTSDYSGEAVTSVNTADASVRIYAKWSENTADGTSQEELIKVIEEPANALTVGEIVAISVTCGVVLIAAVLLLLAGLKKQGKLRRRI